MLDPVKYANGNFMIYARQHYGTLWGVIFFDSLWIILMIFLIDRYFLNKAYASLKENKENLIDSIANDCSALSIVGLCKKFNNSTEEGI